MQGSSSTLHLFLRERHTNFNIRLSFINEPYIAAKHDNEIQWYKQSDCVWSWGLTIADSGRIDLSEQYKYLNLEPLFMGFLGVEMYGAAYKELVESTLLDVSMETTKQLIFSLSASILEHGHLLNPDRFLSSEVLPVRETNGQVRLDSSDTEFYIVDRKFCQCFSEKVPVLDFTPHEVWLLEPLLVWADLESRYLSWNVADTTYLEDPAPELLTGSFTAAKARGLIRYLPSPSWKLYKIPNTYSVLQAIFGALGPRIRDRGKACFRN